MSEGILGAQEGRKDCVEFVFSKRFKGFGGGLSMGKIGKYRENWGREGGVDEVEGKFEIE